jgi:hypothetical protein
MTSIQEVRLGFLQAPPPPSFLQNPLDGNVGALQNHPECERKTPNILRKQTLVFHFVASHFTERAVTVHLVFKGYIGTE